MRHCIKYYPSKSPFNFLIRPWRFYYFKTAKIYMMYRRPIIFLKEIDPDVRKIQFFEYITHKEIPLYNEDYFELSIDEYMVITYTDGAVKKFKLEFYSYGLLELEEMKNKP